jgi:hypothetical protein
VRATVGLSVQADDVDDSNDLDVRRQQVRCSPDDVRDREGLLAWQVLDLDRPVGPDFLLACLGEVLLKPAGTSGRLKSIRASSGSMFPPVTRAP